MTIREIRERVRNGGVIVSGKEANLIVTHADRLAEALRLVLGSTLFEADGHDWTTCEQFSCRTACAILKGHDA